MNWYEGAFLGFLQGATEFLPVSSSGHLVMGQAFLDIRLPGVGFEVALHMATLASVALVYRERIATVAAGVARRDPEQLRYAGLLLLASAPAGVAGVGFGGFFESLFESPTVVGAALIATGFLLWSSRRALDRSPSARPGVGAAVAMGFAQALAIVPGVSRSGATVVAALWKGVEPSEAAAFSFLMSVPAVAGAALLKFPEAASAGAGAGLAAGLGVSVPTLAVAAVVACLVGALAIRVFRAMLASRSFHRFAPYLWAAGAALLWLGGRS